MTIFANGRIYVASSWRNEHQPEMVDLLRANGHEVYDFRNPKPGDNGFHWSDIDPDWKQWTPDQFVKALQHPVAKSGFRSDFDAMRWAEACVLVMPCGRSAHLEAGYFVGADKPLVICQTEAAEPDLMYAMADAVVTSFDGVVFSLSEALCEHRKRRELKRRKRNRRRDRTT